MRWSGTDIKIGLLLALFVAYHYFTVVHPQQFRVLLSLPASSMRKSPVPDVIASNIGVHVGSTGGTEHDIVVLSANYAYLDFLINWVCNANALNLKFVIIPQDGKLYDYLRNNTDLPVIDGAPLGISGSSKVVWAFQPGWNSVTVGKLKAVATILRMLLDSSPPQATPHVLYTDTDLIWRRDPYQYLRRDVDLEIPTDHPDGHEEYMPGDDMCNGFMYVRANNRTIDMLERSLDPHHNDQDNVHATLDTLLATGAAVYVPRNAKAPQAEDVLTFRQLPPLSFPNGAVSSSKDYEQRRQAAGSDQVVLHVNWLKGPEAKRARLHELGLWKVNKTTTSCEGQPNCYGKDGRYWLSCALEGQNVTLRQ